MFFVSCLRLVDGVLKILFLVSAAVRDGTHPFLFFVCSNPFVKWKKHVKYDLVSFSLDMMSLSLSLSRHV